MEKKLILLLHVRSIEYMRLVLWLLSLELKCNAFIIKYHNFWFSSYFEKSKTIFVTVNFFFFPFVVYFEPCCTYLNHVIFLIVCLKLAMNHASCFNSILTIPYFQWQGWTMPWTIPHSSGAYKPCIENEIQFETLYIILNEANKLFLMDF